MGPRTAKNYENEHTGTHEAIIISKRLLQGNIWGKNEECKDQELK